MKSLNIFASQFRKPFKNSFYKNAQMAELVDALVSNTNVFGRAGSTPALGTEKPDNLMIVRLLCFKGGHFRGF